jgi:transcriptional regulator with XRE-family HTH domain
LIPYQSADLVELKLIFGSALRQRRTEMGLTQREMAAQHGLSQHVVSAVENGKNNTTISRRVRLAAAVDGDVPAMRTKTLD